MLGNLLPALTPLSLNPSCANEHLGPDDPCGFSHSDAIRFKQHHFSAAMAVLEQLKSKLPGNRSSTLFNAAAMHLQQLMQSSGGPPQAAAYPAQVDFKTDLRTLIGGKRKSFKPSPSGLKYLSELRAYWNAGRLGLPPPSMNHHIHIRRALAAYLSSVCKASGLKLGYPLIRSVERLLIQEWINTLNQQDWTPLEHRSTLRFADSTGQTRALHFQTRQTPAAHLSEPLRARYQHTGVKGMCSYAAQEKRHAVNLWRTTFKAHSGDYSTRLFSGLRHAVHDAYGLGNQPDERLKANRARVEEFVQACVIEHLGRSALSPIEIFSGVIHLPVVSVNLLTPVGPEKEMIEHQVRALRQIEATGMNVQLADELGSVRQVLVKPQFLNFNVPVNQVALHPTGKYLGIWQRADTLNTTALQALLGSSALTDEVGGMAGKALARAEGHRAVLEALGATTSTDDQLKHTELGRQIEWIKALVVQIRTIILKQSHQTVGEEPYKLAVRLLALANECNAVPAFNCKSGKDRTGQLHVEIRDFYADSWAYGRPRPVDQPRTHWARSNYHTLFTEGADRKVQALNTGVPGSKSQLPYYNKMLGVLPSKMDAIKGLSKWVGT